MQAAGAARWPSRVHQKPAVLPCQHFSTKHKIKVLQQALSVPERQAVLEGLRLSTPKEAHEQAVATIRIMLEDDVFLVRRTAARALARLSQDELHTVVDRLSREEASRLRTHAVEAASWLIPLNQFREYFERARQDCEKQVRLAAIRSLHDRQTRDRAYRYLQIILSAKPDALIGAWRYGQAIIDLGDDDVIHQLQEASGSDEPFHKRAWCHWLAEKTEKRWKDLTSRWERDR